MSKKKRKEQEREDEAMGAFLIVGALVALKVFLSPLGALLVSTASEGIDEMLAAVKPADASE